MERVRIIEETEKRRQAGATTTVDEQRTAPVIEGRNE